MRGRTLQEIVDLVDNLRPSEIEFLKKVMHDYQEEIIVNTLALMSYNELEAVKMLFSDRKISKQYSAKDIIQKTGVTRSTLVNAIDKLQAAGIIEQRSMGCKGLYLKVIDLKFFDILFKN